MFITNSSIRAGVTKRPPTYRPQALTTIVVARRTASAPEIQKETLGGSVAIASGIPRRNNTSAAGQLFQPGARNRAIRLAGGESSDAVISPVEDETCRLQM